MEKPPPRKPQQSSDSFPAVSPAQEEKLWEVLGRLDKELKEINRDRGKDLKRVLEIEERVDDHDEALREMRVVILERFDRLDGHVSRALEKVAESTQQSLARTVISAREEAAQNIKLIELEAKLREIGSAAGKKAGLTWGSGSAVIGTILGAIIHYLLQAAQ